MSSDRVPKEEKNLGSVIELLSGVAGIVAAIWLALHRTNNSDSAQNATGNTPNEAHKPSDIGLTKTECPENKTPYKKKKWHQKPGNWIKTATLIFVVIYTVFSGCQLKIASDTFEASNRPYVGLNSVTVGFIDSDGKTFTEKPTDRTIGMAIDAEIKNFGPVPGRQFTTEARILIDGRQIEESKIPDKPSTIFPGQHKFRTGRIGADGYKGAQGGTEVLQIEVSVDYFGPSGHYNECQKEQYQPLISQFVDLGASCTP